MLYRNYTNKPVYVVVKSVKTKVMPDEIVNLTYSDLNHSGGSLRFFESVRAAETVKKEKLSEIPKKENKIIKIEKETV